MEPHLCTFKPRAIQEIEVGDTLWEVLDIACVCPGVREWFVSGGGVAWCWVGVSVSVWLWGEGEEGPVGRFFARGLEAAQVTTYTQVNVHHTFQLLAVVQVQGRQWEVAKHLDVSFRRWWCV